MTEQLGSKQRASASGLGSLQLKVEFPDMNAAFKDLGLQFALAQTRGMGDAVDQWKKRIRSLVRQNFKRTPGFARSKGLNFEKSFQGASFPAKKRGGKQKVSFRPAGWLNAKAAFAPIFEEGGTVAARGKFLAIALPAAKKLALDYGFANTGVKGLRFSKYSQVDAANRSFGKLRLIPAASGNLILAADKPGSGRGLGHFGSVKARGKADFIPLFLLVRRVRLPKKLSFHVLAKFAAAAVPDFVVTRYRELKEIVAKAKGKT